MAKVVSLFGSAQDAEKMLERLQEPRFKDVDVRIIERTANRGGTGTATATAPAPAAPSGVAANPPAPLPLNFDEGLAGAGLDEAERSFFVDGVRGGGVLVVAESSDDVAGEIRQIMAEHNGRVAGGPQEAA
jgi:hypothetical protein